MLTALALSAGLIVSAAGAVLAAGRFHQGFNTQALAMLSWITLSLALVQLYRSEQTVLTMIRGWMYVVAIMAGITGVQWITSDVTTLNGPFPSPAYLAGAMVAGVLVMPIGFALEKDRWLKWTYPVLAVLATAVVWSTHRSVAFAFCLAVLLVWLALHRWILALAIAAAGTATLVFLRSAVTFRWADAGWEPPLPPSVRTQLTNAAWQILQDSHFLGTGPGSIHDQWPAALKLYQGPYAAVLEIACQYGLAITVVIVCALLGVLVWCVGRLWHTRGMRLASAERAPALWLALAILSLPVTTSFQAESLNFPLSALAAATLALLARHIESPRGRSLVWSGTPGTPPGTAPDPTSGTTPEPTSGTTPEPTSGTTPEPTSGTAPDPTSGTTPEPTSGTTPKLTSGTTPKLTSGTAPEPTSGTAPEPTSGTAPVPPHPAEATSPSPQVAEEAGGPPDHTECLDDQQCTNPTPPEVILHPAERAGAPIADEQEDGEPQQNGPGQRDQPDLA